MGEGLEQERCSLVGCGPLSGWIDFARVELHDLPCISLFFSQPGELHSRRRAHCFLDYGSTKGYKTSSADEVSYLQLRGFTLWRRDTQRKSRGN